MTSLKTRPAVDDKSLGILSQAKNILTEGRLLIGLKSIVKERLAVLYNFN
jgi:hypothetical protein